MVLGRRRHLALALRKLTVGGQHDRKVPGTIITREYKGETLHVTVLPQGFEFEGEVYKSLSAAAKAITSR